MTKKDFELIASIIKSQYQFDYLSDKDNNDNQAYLYDLIYQFCEIYANKYPRFNKDKFLLACGVKE